MQKSSCLGNYALILTASFVFTLLIAGSQTQAMSKEEYEMHQAAAEGALTPIMRLHQQGSSLNVSDVHGVTPLLSAVAGGHASVVQYLIENKALIDPPSEDGTTPLLMAVEKKYQAIAEYLVEKGADVNKVRKDGAAPLHLAMTNGDLEMSEYLLDHGAKVDARMNNGATPLHIAVRLGNLSLVELLVSHGARINIKDKNTGATPLHIAAAAGYPDIVQFLLKNKAKVNATDSRGISPLHLAAFAGQVFIAKELVEGGADPAMKDAQGMTPADLALREGRDEVSKYLLAPRPSSAVPLPSAIPPNQEATKKQVAEIKPVEIKAPAVENWSTFFFPECQVKIAAPQGWFARNETRLVKPLDEKVGQIPVGKLFVFQEQAEERASVFDAGFKTGVTFYPNYQFITNKDYESTEAFANDIIPYLQSNFKEVKNRKEFYWDGPMGRFKVVEITVPLGRDTMTFAYGALKGNPNDMIFVLQSPEKEWNTNRNLLYEILRRVVPVTEASSEDQIKPSVFDQSAE